VGKKLYCGNLGYNVTSSDLDQLFCAIRDGAERLRVINDRDTGRSKGFGFVEMGSDAEAQAAISGINGTEHDGRTLTVNEARPREERRGGGGGGGRWWSRRLRWWRRRWRTRRLRWRWWRRWRPTLLSQPARPETKNGPMKLVHCRVTHATVHFLFGVAFLAIASRKISRQGAEVQRSVTRRNGASCR